MISVPNDGVPDSQMVLADIAGWKNKVAFFTKYWAAGNYEVTTNAIVQLTHDLERTQEAMEGISSKAANPVRRSWQGNANGANKNALIGVVLVDSREA